MKIESKKFTDWDMKYIFHRNLSQGMLPEE